MTNSKKTFFLTVVCVVLMACDGGGSSSSDSSSSVSGLSLPAQMSVVTAQEDSNAVSLRRSVVDTSGFAANADYNQDKSRAYVYDPSMESLDTVNMILCLMDQTRASDMVNQGAYYALVDEDKCEQGQNQSAAAETGQSSGGGAKQFNKWTIRATREDNSSPMVVQIWVPDDNPNDNESETILVELTATEGVSSSKPFGSFVMNFKGVDPANGEAVQMRGILQTVANDQGQPQFQFVNLGGGAINPNITNFSFNEAASVVLDDVSGTGGVAKTLTSFSDGVNPDQIQTYVVAFNATHLLRGKDQNDDDTADEQTCLSRTTFDRQIWRYNLYNRSTGSRAEIQSGFPFTYASQNGTINGHAGYHGLWAEGDTDIPDGATITRINYDNDSTSDYTVHYSSGKLLRRVKGSGPLTVGDEFNGFFDHPASNYGFPGEHNYNAWAVTVSENYDFVVTGGLRWGESGPQVEAVQGADATTLSLADNETLWLWSDALGGNVVYLHKNAVQANARTMTFYKEEFVSPSDALFANGAVTLDCYDRCIKGGDLSGAANEGQLYYTTDGTKYQYTATVADGKIVLRDVTGANAVVSAVGADLSGIGHEWGVQSGEMLPGGTAITNPWEVYEQDVSYRWETGDNQWNKQVVLINTATQAVTSFDKPMQFTYTLEAADEVNAKTTHVGKTFLLQYGGNGDLHGFPWKQEGERWHTAVNLKNAVLLGSVDSVEYITKAIEMEQSLKPAPGECGALNIATLFADPALQLLTSNDIGNVSITWAGRPTPADMAPQVIEGELQD